MKIVAAAALALVGLAGCSAIPRDPDHTLDRVRAHRVLRLGVSPNPPWTTVDPDSVGGSEVELVREFAARQGARVEIVVGGEEPLVTKLEEGEIDAMVGGLTTSNKWSTKLGATRAYTKSNDATGKTKKHIMAVPLGENQLLSELERFLDEKTGKTR